MTTGNDLIDDYLSELMDDPGKGKPSGKPAQPQAAAAETIEAVDATANAASVEPAATPADAPPGAADAVRADLAPAVEPPIDDAGTTIDHSDAAVAESTPAADAAVVGDATAIAAALQDPAAMAMLAAAKAEDAPAERDAPPAGDPLAAFREGSAHIGDDEFEAMLDALQGKPASAAPAPAVTAPAASSDGGDPLAAFREGGANISDDEFEAMLDVLAGAPAPATAPAAMAAPAPAPLAEAAPISVAEPPVHRPRLPAAALEQILPGSAPAPTIVHETGGERRRRADDRIISWLRFNLARQCFAVEVLKVQEVLRVPFILPVRGTEAAMLGVMNLRGQIVPVMDLAIRLGFDPVEPNEASRVIVLEENGETLGVMVASVADVLNLSEGRMEKISGTPSLVAAEVVRGISRRDGAIIIMLDATRLLA